MGNAQSNNNRVDYNNAQRMFMQPVNTRPVNNRQVDNNYDTSDTLDWSETAVDKSGKFDIKQALGLKTYYTEPLSDASEYDLSKFKGGMGDSDELSSFGMTNNMAGGSQVSDANASDLNNVRKFIEQELQSGGRSVHRGGISVVHTGGGSIIRGTRPLVGGKKHNVTSSSSTSESNNDSEGNHANFHSESSDSQVFRGYRVR
jgi:hypothetical protein